MKNIFIIILSFFALFSSAQIDYPKYSVDSLGQKIVLLTIDQAMRLDNNSELLGLFEKLNSQISDYDSVCIKVVNDKERVINAQKLEISEIKKSLENKDSQILALQKEVASYIVRIKLLEEESANRQGVIDEKNLQLGELRTKMLFGGFGGGLIIIGLIGAILLTH
jgi:hypothetical protein